MAGSNVLPLSFRKGKFKGDGGKFKADGDLFLNYKLIHIRWLAAWKRSPCPLICLAGYARAWRRSSTKRHLDRSDSTRVGTSHTPSRRTHDRITASTT